MKKVILLLTLFALNLSCEKEIELNAEEQQPRIVVNCTFNETDTVKVELSESRSLLESPILPLIEDADLRLYRQDGTEIGAFTYSPSIYTNTHYSLAADELEPGNTYTIKANKSTFESVEASSYIPSKIIINAIDTTTNIPQQNEMKFTVNFSDNAAEKNYYILSSTVVVYTIEDMDDTLILFKSVGMSTKEFIAANGNQEPDGTIYGAQFVFTDELFNGENFSFDYQQELNYPGEFEDVESYCEVRIQNVSEDFYKYQRSLAVYQSTENSPFAEPVQVYTNVKNGFGLFAGYSQSTRRIVLN